MNTTTEEFQAFTYEQKVAWFRDVMGFNTHEIRIKSSSFGNQVIQLKSEEDALKLALALVTAARECHNETWESHRYGNDTLETLIDNEEFFEGTYHWSVTVWNLLPRNQYNEEEVERNYPEFYFGHRRGAYQMANPKSRVFVSTGGRDCDGYRWRSVSEHETLLEAHEYVEQTLSGADGPTGWSVISQDDYEHFDGSC